MLLRDSSGYSAIYIACGATDLRKSVDGLACIVKQDFKLDPFGNYLFLFCNKGRNRLKGLCWDRNGFILCYKRLDGSGAKFQWPKNQEAVRDITNEQLRLLLDGLSIDPPKGFGDITARDFN
jgi:transposase